MDREKRECPEHTEHERPVLPRHVFSEGYDRLIQEIREPRVDRDLEGEGGVTLDRIDGEGVVENECQSDGFANEDIKI